MYFYFALMGILGIFVMIGYRYRLSLFCFSVLWTAQYLMQKTAYNNHYYFLILICFIMLFLPANTYYSMDVKRNEKIKSLTMPQWCSFVLILQVSILYFYATVAKLYPDWLDGTFTSLLYSRKTEFPVIGKFFTEKWFYIPIAYLGILFDGLVVPFLLWRKTRTLALLANFIFHLSNSFILQVGIFPYFALSFVVFFYPPETTRKLFFKKRPTIVSENYNFQYKQFLYPVFFIYFIIQIVLPIRHYFIRGDVFWTEEGHRLSWRMMLRQRTGNTSFTVIDKKTKEILPFEMHEVFTQKQLHKINCYPDYIWQAAQYIKQDFKKRRHKDVEIYADTQVSVNGHPYKKFINNKIDLTTSDWNYFSHSEWILLYDDYRK